jgi:hypothetical protein
VSYCKYDDQLQSWVGLPRVEKDILGYHQQLTLTRLVVACDLNSNFKAQFKTSIDFQYPNKITEGGWFEEQKMAISTK